jgi:signal transduction histidine kinase
MADGRLLWRVISNLLSNVFKYSQDGTRVYIDFYDQQTKKGNVVVMEMKNISRQSLNVEPEVLMERFNRGDASRTIEGSGLGLTIAKDLMKLMGGWIDITIDGDLFKVKLMLKSAEQEKKPLIINEL